MLERAFKDLGSTTYRSRGSCDNGISITTAIKVIQKRYLKWLLRMDYLDWGWATSLSWSSASSLPSSSSVCRFSMLTWQMVKLWLNVCSQAFAITSFDVDIFLKTTPFTPEGTSSELGAPSAFVSAAAVLASASAPDENFLYSFKICFSATMQMLWLLSLA